MTIQEFAKNDCGSIIFDPIPSYAGEWSFGVQNLLQNSLRKDEKNLFQDFYQRTLINPLQEIFKILELDFAVGFISLPNDNKIGRVLKYSKEDFFITIISLLNKNIDRYKKSDEENKEYLKGLLSHLDDNNEDLNLLFSEALKEKAEKLKDVMENEINSEYFEAAMQDYGLYKKEMSFAEYIKKTYQTIAKLQVGMLRLGDFFDHIIDYKSFFSCFETEKFYLLFAKIISDLNYEKDVETHSLDNTFSYLQVFKNFKVEKDIIYILASGEKIRYSQQQFFQDYEFLKARHQNIEEDYLSDFHDEKFRDINLMNKIKELYSYLQTANFNICTLSDLDNFIVSSNSQVSLEKWQVLKDMKFVGKPLQGKNNFQGYYAFLYSPDYIVLENFSQEKNVTYIMNIDEFMYMCSSSLSVSDYLKTVSNGNFKRVFNTDINNWQRNLSNEINGNYRLQDALDFIDSLQIGEQSYEQ